MLRTGPLTTRVLPHTHPVQWTGDIVQIAGLAFCVWARLHIGRNWSGTITLKEGHTLVRTGPYALVRHPITPACRSRFSAGRSSTPNSAA